MAKLLKDYSGDFDPDFSYDKLSRETLLELLRAYGDYVRMIDGNWYMEVLRRCGNEIAFACDTSVWMRLDPFEMETTKRLLGTGGDTPLAMAKTLQASPWASVYKTKVEVINEDHVILTYLTCPTIVSLEKEGTGREKFICQGLEVKLMSVKAYCFNPAIKITPLKLPPRNGPDDVCCVWELTLGRSK
jgi:hypothetical protein